MIILETHINLHLEYVRISFQATPWNEKQFSVKHNTLMQ